MTDANADADTELLDEGLREELSVESRIERLFVRELGAETGNAFARARAAQERHVRRLHPHEGLRERKKRILRQQISDVATILFIVRGFEHVTVAEIAGIVGVSEKTVYNHFPTKESLVFDRADEGIARLLRALREREPGESPTRAMLRALSEGAEAVEALSGELDRITPLFAEMVASTPSLRGALLDLQGRLVQVATDELAARAEVDPREPEPMIAARAIVGLQELSFASRVHHIERGLRGGELRDAVRADLERAARLLDAGLWSFNLLAQGARTRQQLSDAAAAAEEARKQVVRALRQARTAWRAARQSKHSLRDAHELAEQAAYEAFRQMLRDRHDAVRARQG